jgi:ABC-2 type transport system ATP-binding protein
MSELAIDVHDLTKVFDERTVVDKISLQVERGSVFGFLGSNGSGKTTTIRMICGLLTPSSGEGQCLGLDIKKQHAEIKGKISYMPQKFCLYNGLTVYENLQFLAKIYKIPQYQQVMNEILEDLELTPYKNIKAGNLSGGWKQRMTLGCCLLHKPELLFLDEPTAGVDPKARKDFWNYLHKISRRDKTTILVTTHYMDEAEKCTELAYINLGKLLYSGATKELIPFSKVKTFTLNQTDSPIQNKVAELIAQRYPKLLASIINNDLRISSVNLALLDQLITEQKEYSFNEVVPNFEEVFIGLMP